MLEVSVGPKGDIALPGFSGVACPVYASLRSGEHVLVASKRAVKSGPFAIYNCFRNSRSALFTSLARSC